MLIRETWLLYLNKKTQTLNMSCNTSHFSCLNHSHWSNQWNLVSFREWVSGTFHFVKMWGHSRKNLSKYDIRHSSVQLQKLKTCMTGQITNCQSSSSLLKKLRDVFRKVPLFSKKLNVILIWLGSKWILLLKIGKSFFRIFS